VDTIAHDAPRAAVEPLDGIMVFDGVCNLCSTSVRLVAAMDRRRSIRFAPTQSPVGRSLCAQARVDPSDPTTFLFFDKGEALEASSAMTMLAARLAWPWNGLRWLRLIPRPLRDALYFWVARNRYRLFGRRRRCMIPSPALRSRFLDGAPGDAGAA
jgi:predicted DCC family thiol-disulfide oxidoreductase YuxK